MQLGGDIAQWSRDESDRWHLGLMAGYGNSHNNTRSSVTNYRADSSISGYSLGAYGTWQQDEGENTGAYVDTWVLYNWFNNKVKGQDLSGESYQSKDGRHLLRQDTPINSTNLQVATVHLILGLFNHKLKLFGWGHRRLSHRV